MSCIRIVSCVFGKTSEKHMGFRAMWILIWKSRYLCPAWLPFLLLQINNNYIHPRVSVHNSFFCPSTPNLQTKIIIFSRCIHYIQMLTRFIFPWQLEFNRPSTITTCIPIYTQTQQPKKKIAKISFHISQLPFSLLISSIFIRFWPPQLLNFHTPEWRCRNNDLLKSSTSKFN